MIFSPVDPGGSQVEEHTIYETLATNISQNKEKKDFSMKMCHKIWVASHSLLHPSLYLYILLSTRLSGKYLSTKGQILISSQKDSLPQILTKAHSFFVKLPNLSNFFSCPNKHLPFQYRIFYLKFDKIF